ncbi:MAG: SDR family NAD(P)-dependent oxidoreductase [Pseudoflavonifractor sp.]|nr:SDR family NAD(P)-dependent oxidoreductase [Pseudoflavonifractor sp.]
MSGDNQLQPAVTVTPWAVVTGASSGIGLEFSRQLASLGYNLLMVSNQMAELTQHAAQISADTHATAIPMCLDLTVPDASDRVVAWLRDNGVTPTLLINNAGIFDFKAVEDMSPRRIDLYIDLHMRAVTHLSRAIGDMMAAAGNNGRILNMSSMSCWMPMPGIAMYSATKAYIRAFSRAYRIEMKPRHVSVTVACPGGIATDLFGLPPKLQRLGVALRVLDTPSSFVSKAIRKTLKGKAQYINGGLNRLSIVAVACLPEWGRSLIKSRLLDRLNKKQ